MIRHRIAEYFVILLQLILIPSLTAQKYDGWQIGTPQMPRYVTNGAIGYSSVTGAIVILDRGETVTEFVDGSTPITYANALQRDIDGWGQYWTQIGEYLYVIDPMYASSFMRYNLETRVDEWYYQGIVIPVYEDYQTYYYSLFTCLTSVNVAGVDYLVVLGGSKRGSGGSYSGMKNAQIVSLSTYEWESNVPNMNTARMSSACATVEQTIYIIGGTPNDITDLNTVEKLTITDMSSKPSSWTILSNRLSEGMRRNRALVYGTDILVFFSYDAHNIDVIDTVTDTITSDGYISIDGSDSVAVAVYNRLYCFHKYDWRYMDAEPLFTFDPTSATGTPTKTPTESTTAPSESTLYPSSMPSRAPSSEPTAAPSDSTAYPSSMPSTAPSYEPTVSPSQSTAPPSSMPSRNPSAMPSTDPSLQPSIPPTLEPTASPTVDPSSQPSVSPSSPPTANPSSQPSVAPSPQPTAYPSTAYPSLTPTVPPTRSPSSQPSVPPTRFPSLFPSLTPTVFPSDFPTFLPSVPPTGFPTSSPTLYHSTDAIATILYNKQEEFTSSTGFYLLVIVCTMPVVCACIVYVVYRIKNAYKKQEQATEMMQQNAGESWKEKRVSDWNENDVYEWICSMNKNLKSLADIFKDNRIRGRVLEEIAMDDMIELGVDITDVMEFEIIRDELFKEDKGEKDTEYEVESAPGAKQEHVDDIAVRDRKIPTDNKTTGGETPQYEGVTATSGAKGATDEV